MRPTIAASLVLIAMSLPAAGEIIRDPSQCDEPAWNAPPGMLSDTIKSDKFLTNVSIVNGDANCDGFFSGGPGVMANPTGYVLMHPFMSRLNVRVTLGQVIDSGTNTPLETPHSCESGPSFNLRSDGPVDIVVPEPATIALLALGSLALLVRKKQTPPAGCRND